MSRYSRRQLLAGLGALGSAALAGCSSDAGDGGATPATTTAGGTATESAAAPATPPTAEGTLRVAYPYDRLREAVVSGTPGGKDAIPSIDDPTFAAADAVDLDPEAIVFGAVRNGQAKAYPQYVLVLHEIVNDRLGGDPVSVTYCPLTGTAVGFERGETTFGVSGNLLNSNLVMYDRETDSRWPQVLATAIEGPHRGRSLRDFRLVWTSWERWRAAHPETEVLTEDTGYARRYGGDPYGSYNPREGYYAPESETAFPSLTTDDRFPPKTVVIGARTADAALAVRKDALRSAGLVELTAGGTDHLVVYDPDLDTGYVYANPEGLAFEYADGEVSGPDGTHAPADLPLERVLAMDAMWFAWAGLYPDTAVHG